MFRLGTTQVYLDSIICTAMYANTMKTSWWLSTSQGTFTAHHN